MASRHYCSSCARGKIEVNNTPVYTTPYRGLTTSERTRANRFAAHYWNETLDPVSKAQQARNQENAIKKLLPWYIDNGGSIRTAAVTDFYM